MRPILLCGTILLFFLACAVEGEKEGRESDEEAVFPPSAAPDIGMAPPPAPARTERRVVRNAELSLIVADTPAAADRLVELADSLGGYASDIQADRRDKLMHYRIVLRVPAARLDQALAAVKALAVRVENEALQTEDVTEQVVDLEARLKTLVATEAELQALLAESRSRRSDVEEIMAIYRELTGIRTHIEQTRAQLEMIESRVALSTITVQLRPEAGSGPLVGDRWRPGGTVRSAVRTLVDALQGIADVAIYAAIVLVPIVVLLTAPLVLFVLLRRRRTRKGPAA
ncbi:MAG: DUF4349 domain-containing protein [Gemmatimonadota bacterium]